MASDAHSVLAYESKSRNDNYWAGRLVWFQVWSVIYWLTRQVPGMVAKVLAYTRKISILHSKLLPLFSFFQTQNVTVSQRKMTIVYQFHVVTKIFYHQDLNQVTQYVSNPQSICQLCIFTVLLYRLSTISTIFFVGALTLIFSLRIPACSVYCSFLMLFFDANSALNIIHTVRVSMQGMPSTYKNRYQLRNNAFFFTEIFSSFTTFLSFFLQICFSNNEYKLEDIVKITCQVPSSSKSGSKPIIAIPCQIAMLRR